MADSREVVFELLTRACFDIKEEAAKFGSARAYHLAGLFESIGFELSRADRGEIDDDQVLEDLKRWAKDRGIEAWLDHGIRQIEQSRGEDGLPQSE